MVDTATPLSGSRWAWISTAALLVLVVLTPWRYSPPAPLPRTAPAGQFSALRAQDILRRLVGDGVPHPIGSPGNAAMRARVLHELDSLGLAHELQSGTVCHDGDGCGFVTNIIAPVGGGTGAAVLLVAHYDSVPAGPGASDDGAGVAAVLEIARILKAGPPLAHPVILLIDDGEEAGLLGARLFVEDARWSSKVAAAVNLEARGTSGPSLMFETGSANDWLMQRYARTVAGPLTNSVFYLGYRLVPNTTDFTVFKTVDYQGFNLAFIGDVEHYHTPQDSWSNTDLGSLQDQGANALALVRSLADSDLAKRPHSQAVFSDLFRVSFIQWRAALTPAFALLAAALLLLSGWRLRSRADFAPRQLLVAVPAIVGGWVACLLAVLLLWWLGGGAASIGSFVAHPLPLLTAAYALGFLAPALAALLAWRTGFWALWLAAQILYAVLSIALAFTLPELSFLVLLPLAVALVALLPVLLQRAASSSWAAAAALLPLLAGALLVLPLCGFFYEILGVAGVILISALLGLGILGLAPLLAVAAPGARRLFVLLPALAAVLGLLLGTVLPRYTPAVPEEMGIQYWQDADSHQAHWGVAPGSGQLPAYLATVASFDPQIRSALPGLRKQNFLAPAAALDLPGPTLTVLDTTRDTGGVRYHVRVRSGRGAPEVLLFFPAASGVKEVQLGSEHGLLHMQLPGSPERSLLDIAALPPEGAELYFTAHGAFNAELLDESYSLPQGGQALQRARDAHGTARGDGDITVFGSSIPFPPQEAGGAAVRGPDQP